MSLTLCFLQKEVIDIEIGTKTCDIMNVKVWQIQLFTESPDDILHDFGWFLQLFKKVDSNYFYRWGLVIG